MTTIDDLMNGNHEGFIYNKVGFMDIDFDDKEISIDKIKTDGYEIGVNHRPLRTPHVNKIASNFIGDTIHIKAVFDSRDGCYHIIQGQHVFTALKSISYPPAYIICGIIKNKTTGIQLDACKKEDREICFQYSYRVTDGQEKNCISDKICMVTELSDKYKESGNTKGVIDYVYEHQYGFQKLSLSTLKLYSMYGHALKKHNLLIYAQKEHWDEKMIKARIEEYKLKKKDYQNITLRLDKDTAMRFIENGLLDNTFWKEALSYNKKLSKQKILDSYEEYA